MKKAVLYAAMTVLMFAGCKSDDEEEAVVVTTTEEQKVLDDEAAMKYLDEHYFDAKGNVVEFSSTDEDDDDETKLSAYEYTKLPSGVIYLLRPGAQPDPGTAIGATDVIKMMQKTVAFVARRVDGNISLTSTLTFANPINGAGVPTNDPYYYYVKESLMTSSGKGRSYYEIEGLQEGLKYVKAFSIPDSDNYNLQGIIIVPSRAAYAKDENVNSFTDYSFVFNFQIYSTRARLDSEK